MTKQPLDRVRDLAGDVVETAVDVAGAVIAVGIVAMGVETIARGLDSDDEAGDDEGE